MFKRIIIYTFLILSLSSTCYAQNQLTQEQIQQINKIINPQNNNNVNINNIKEMLNDESNLTKLKNGAKVFADLLKDVCQTLNVEVNSFAKSPVGLFIIVLTALHYLGGSLSCMVMLFINLFIFLPIWIYTFTRFYNRKEIIIDKEKKTKTINQVQYHFNTNDARQLCAFFQIVGIAVIVIIAIVSCTNMFH